MAQKENTLYTISTGYLLETKLSDGTIYRIGGYKNGNLNALPTDASSVLVVPGQQICMTIPKMGDI